MGFRFRRRIKIAPGFSINLGKRGASLTVGGRGAHITVGDRGTTSTVGLPGTGLSYSEHTPAHHRQARASATPERTRRPSVVLGYIWMALIASVLLLILHGVFGN